MTFAEMLAINGAQDGKAWPAITSAEVITSIEALLLDIAYAEYLQHFPPPIYQDIRFSSPFIYLDPSKQP